LSGDVAAISGWQIAFSYEFDGLWMPALDGVDITVGKGEWIAVLGQNGCGKSTLAKHFNGLLPIQRGELRVGNIDVRNKEEIWRLRRLCGMVFQNPDNQFVSSVVEEDIAFGLENHQVPRSEIPEKVRHALRLVDMEGFEKRAPYTLSGGQKQRVALAGVLVLDPDMIVLDEATAMLDPEGRREVLDTVSALHRDTDKTIVFITHYVEEAIFADKVCLMREGKVIAFGTPREVLTDREQMDKAGIIPPLPVRMYHDLKAAGILLGRCPLSQEELVEEICRLNS